ncbi:MAG: hypothetical protein RIR26_1943 [Pseudomonadota bacterium]|jgi:uncharacterized oxidoreductase
MQFKEKTFLITGGASGIGLGLAIEFLAAGNRVIICGRRPEKLQEAKKKYPMLETLTGDIQTKEGRLALSETVFEKFPDVDVLVNNAGIQRRVNLLQSESWDLTESEIATNLHAPIHLSQLFLEHLNSKSSAAIMNVTSGLAFVPIARMPLYCATKAALRSFTMSLREQLSGTAIKVIEIIPPAVNTDLGGTGLHTFGVPVDEFSKAVVSKIFAGEVEVAYGTADNSRRAFQPLTDEIFKRMNAH